MTRAPAPPAPPRHAPVMKPSLLAACAPGWETILAGEIGRTLPGAQRRVPDRGWVLASAVPDAPTAPALAFASQVLPDPEPLPAPSVALAADALAARVRESLGGHPGPWRLHVFGVEWPGSPVRAARAALIARESVARLRRRCRRLAATLVVDPAIPFAPDEWLVQLALPSPRLGWYAASAPAARLRWRHCLSRFPGGLVTPPEDPAPPSRAYRKLLEAEAHLGRSVAAGETVVDLGAAPGGWTHVALARGATVTAVDRSPLRDDLMAHPRLAFVRGDAFRYAPAGRPVDWLLSDVVAFPERNIELLAAWLREGWCRRFVVTVKFRGEEDYPRLERLKRLLAGSCAEYQLRRLGSNKNEVTALGARDG